MNVTSTGIAVALAIVIALAFLFFGPAFLSVFSPQTASVGTDMGTTTDEGVQGTQTNTNGIMITDTVQGSGAEAVAGKTVTVNYVGSLENGQVFDASANHGQPFSFTLGVGQVISGWDEGIVGMKVGGKRHLVIPADKAYGAQAVGSIPANSTLVFDVELLSVQ